MHTSSMLFEKNTVEVHLWDILKSSMLSWETNFRSYDSDTWYMLQILQFKANFKIQVF